MLSYLAEPGSTAPAIRGSGAERYLGLQCDDGDWCDPGSRYAHMSCLLGQNLRTFSRLGYRDDPRIHRTLGLLLDTPRPDGGYLCDMHEGKRVTRPVKSCIRGADKVLLALAEFPETWSHPRVAALVDYFLERGGIYRRGTRQLVNRDMASTHFPVTWRANVWEVLYALAVIGHGADPRLEGLVWVAGLGGHGITCAPFIGRLAAEWITTGGSAHPAAADLAPARLIG